MKININMLIVDDHPGIRLLLLEIFTHEGYNVTIASTGKEAVEWLEKGQFNIVILDYHLPLLNGVEVIEYISEHHKEEKVVLMSGLVEHLQEKIEQYPFVKKVIQKPFDITDLCDSVKEIVNNNS